MNSNTLAARLPQNAVGQLSLPHAVKFGNPSTGDAPKAYPFFYNLIKYPYQEGIADPSTGIYTITGDMAEGPDGLNLNAGGILNAPIIMDDDANFHLLYMKFGAYRKLDYDSLIGEGGTLIMPPGQTITNGMQIRLVSVTGVTVDLGATYYAINAGSGLFQISLTIGGSAIDLTSATAASYVIADPNYGSRERLIYPYVPLGSDNPVNSLFTVGQNARIPYWTEIDVSVYMSSSGARDVMGGFQRAPIGGATEEQPIPLLDLQTTEDGLGMVRVPFQLTKSATVNLKFTSRSAYPLRIYGHLFGYKITV